MEVNKKITAPFFSIIIPTYNRDDFFFDVLNSILVQDFEDYEVIISDDSTTDTINNLVKNIKDPRIKYFRNTIRLGRVANYRESVLNRANGKWCIICDGDDYFIDKEYFSYLKKLIDNHLNLVFVQSGHLKGRSKENAEIEIPNIQKSIEILKGFDYLVKFKQISHFSHLATASLLSVLKTVDPFKMDIVSSDIDTYLRLVRHGDVCLTNRTVGLWRQHEENASGSLNIIDSLKNLKWIDSVVTYWIQILSSQDKNIIIDWGYYFEQESFFYVYKKLIMNSETKVKDVFVFFSSAIKLGYGKFFLFKKKMYKLLIWYLKKQVIELIYRFKFTYK